MYVEYGNKALLLLLLSDYLSEYARVSHNHKCNFTIFYFSIHFFTNGFIITIFNMQYFTLAHITIIIVALLSLILLIYVFRLMYCILIKKNVIHL